jgi:hypothetical protein
MLAPEAQFGREEGRRRRKMRKGEGSGILGLGRKMGVGGLVARSPYIIIHTPYPAVPRLRTKGI